MSSPTEADVLLVESDPKKGGALQTALRDRRYAVEWARTGEKAFNLLDTRSFDVLVADLERAKVDPLRLLAVAQERNAEVCAIFIAEGPENPLAIQAMHQGAYDFQNRPVSMEKLHAVIQRGLAHQRLVYEQIALKRRLDERYGLGTLIGRSKAMVQVYGQVRKIGPEDGPVLICGEPGTGKQLIAQALHHAGSRRDEPFVTVDCASLSEPMTRAELFGQSADTRAGRSRGRQGCFEMADKGTLYLSGLAACAHTLQEEVLKAHQDRSVRRAGDGKRIPVDVRLVVATQQRPYATGARSRSALFDALMQTIIEAPPLRERIEDIPLLAMEMLKRANEFHGRSVEGFARRALDTFSAYPWPGNVRELENTVLGMVATAKSGDTLDNQDVPPAIRTQADRTRGGISLHLGSCMADIERTAIEATLKFCQDDKVACAKMLKIGLRTLYRKLHGYEE